MSHKTHKYLISHFCSDTGTIDNIIIDIANNDIPMDVKLNGTYEMSIKNDDSYNQVVEKFFKDHYSNDVFGIGHYIKLTQLETIE